jgi:hypothetical protein
MLFDLSIDACARKRYLINDSSHTGLSGSEEKSMGDVNLFSQRARPLSPGCARGRVRIPPSPLFIQPGPLLLLLLTVQVTSVYLVHVLETKLY